MFRKTRPLWIATTALFGVLTLVGGIGYSVTSNYSAAINSYFQTKTSMIVEDPDNKGQIFYASDYDFIEDADAGELLAEEDGFIIEEVEREGAVLLKNENDALPLLDEKNISLFGRGSRSIVETGSGSGWIPSNKLSENLKDSLERVGYHVNPDLWNFYANQPLRTEKESACVENATLAVNETAWSSYTSSVKNSFASYSDAAIVVLSRTGGEYSDLLTHGSDSIGGTNNYLALTKNELDLLTNVISLKDGGTFGKVIVLLNSGNPFDMASFEPYMDSIDAMMYIGEVGTTGARAVADLIAGEYSPSGRLTDTWAYDGHSAPATSNSGDYRFANASSFRDDKNRTLAERQSEYMAYQEGIYEGYRYYETRYEDLILGNGNADSSAGSRDGGEWDYDNEVAYPFGYGLSYASFSYSGFDVTKMASGDYEVTVTVKNESGVASKEVVEVYLQKPYTSLDRNLGIEKPAVELAGYAKTGTIAARGETKVTVNVPKRMLLTYDEHQSKGYILEGGDFYFSIGSSAHQAINNILAVKGFGSAIAGADGSLAKKVVVAGDSESFKKSPYGKKVDVTNHFDAADLDYYEGMADDEFEYLSRADWSAFPETNVKLQMTAEFASDVTFDKDYEEDPNAKMPTYDAPFQFGAITLRDRPYDDPLWDQLLDQMSFKEQARMCSNAYHRIESASSIALDQCMTENGPVGLTKRSDFPKTKGEDYIHMAYPCGPVQGSTWNDRLLEDMGKHISEDLLYTGYQGIYGPGLNLHRTMYGGRAWEYASEDPYLTGKAGAALCKGIENKGMTAYVKHFAMNDLETNRRHCAIFANEQTIREIYLLPFELVFASETGDAAAHACMNSFTRMGAVWCGACKELLKDVLREEWGWTGIMISDWDSGDTMSKIDGLLGGSDSFDGNNNESVYAAYKNSPTFCEALREATKHIVFTTVHTNIMNGVSASSKVIDIVPWWQTALIGIAIGCGSATLLCGAFLVLTFIKNKKE